MKVIERKFLPVETRSAHAATVAFFKDHPVFSWFGGMREGSPDVAIYLNNLHGDNGTIVIGENDAIPRWNPILFPLKDKLYLFEKAGIFCDRWQTFIHDITNWDKGISQKEIFGESFVLPAGLNGPVKTKPIVNKDLILCGSSVETIYDWSSYIEYYTIKDNTFEFLRRSAPLCIKEKRNYIDFNGSTRRTLGIIQPSLWQEDKGFEKKGKAFFRSSRDYGKIYYSEREVNFIPSVDINDSWSEPKPTNLNNPNSGMDVVFHNKKLYLAYNPSETKRFPLVVHQIEQKGLDCQFDIIDELVVRENVEEDSPCISPELSYPYMIEHNGLIHLVYTYGRAKIEYCVISID